MARAKKPAPFTGHLVHVVAADVVRVELHDDTDTYHYTALVLTSDQAMHLSREIAKAALAAAPTKKRK